MTKTATKSALSSGLLRTDLSMTDLHIQRVDYEALAKECGDIAYNRAKAAKLPQEVAEKFREVFGKPIDPDLRFS
jgi:hypothetical protein